MSKEKDLDEAIEKLLDSALEGEKKATGLKIGSSNSYIISKFIKRLTKERYEKIWVVVEDERLINNLENDLMQDNKGIILINKRNFKNVKKIFDPNVKYVIVPLSDISEDFPLYEDKSSFGFTIKKGENINANELREYLSCNNYYPVSIVQNESEFCIRGEVIDIFVNETKNPIRIYLDFDSVESIKSFDISSQLARKEDDVYEHITIPSSQDLQTNDVCQLKDYIKDGDKIVLCKSTPLENDIEKNCLAVFESFYNDVDFDIRTDDVQNFKGDIELLLHRINELLEKKFDIYIDTANQIQLKRIKALLSSAMKIDEQVLDEKINFCTKNISQGFVSEKGFAVFTYGDIFSKKKMASAPARLETAAIDSFFALNSGDLVVHADYGIGKFVSLERMEMKGYQRDYIKIEFADEEFYYIPLERANLVQKYIGKEKTTLDNPHSSSWKKKKLRALENAQEFAQKLLSLYAERKHKTAFMHSQDTLWDVKFESLFEYDETIDQLKAIEEVKKDMQSDTAMDRIICGDVGFGKTEVAFRAAFKAIMSGKQVCFLSPTTILTNQHYNNFIARISDFPIAARSLSRMNSAKDSKDCIEKIENGDVDIVFATHKILRSNVKFKRLGLLIIDEEQRFGVSDKEKIKSMKVNVDTLTLTATPIPRTLYMSLINIRSMSLLKTPPALRLSVKVIVDTFDYDKVKDAIEKELNRGGQVYYLHNKTEDLEMITSFLKTSFPDAKIDSVSGKMNTDRIEDSIYEFATGYTDILVCTTIIENGIDVPNANTLIVDDATIYGTSQLYQIKGRVGRGSRQAYAYLMIPKNKVHTPSAMDRIKIVAQNSTLGSGFNIALGDLMLRGSGNILGKKQAGHVEEIGLDMYMHLLDKSIKELEMKEENKVLEEKKYNISQDDEVTISIDYTAYIPDDYIKETQIKFDIYKKIANSTSEDELKCIVENVKNRFGKTPKVFENLYMLSLLKISMRKAGVSEIKEKDSIISLKIEHMKILNIDKVLDLINKHKGDVYLDPHKPNYIMIKTKGIPKDDTLGYLYDIVNNIC